MSEEFREFIGYHGTTHLNAKNIYKNGFIPSNSGWLGEGVYFFESDEKMARSWANKNNKNVRIEVIERKIRVPHEKVFDLVNTLGKDNKLFHEKRLELMKSLTQKGLSIRLDKDKAEEQIRKIETKILKEICKRGGFEVVRAATFTRLNDIDVWSVSPNGVEICVKNLEHIKNRSE